LSFEEFTGVWPKTDSAVDLGNNVIEAIEQSSVLKPFYQDESCTIYNADCRKVLPWLDRFDLLLTDPPYGIGEDGGAQRTRGSKRKNGPKMGWDSKRPSRAVFELMIEAADTHIIWGGNYFADMLPATRGWLYWEKLMGGDFSDGELAWTSRDAVLKQFTKAKQTNERIHPTQKPLAVIQWCLSLVPDAQTVLDPFMGSGTTLLAAKVHGVKSVGIEVNEEYCEAAANRLKQKMLY
jgi:DNA modification methylase